jgi:ribosomal protein L37AE/L43A
VHDAANPSAKSNPNSTEDCDERQIFQTEGEMYTSLREQGYRIGNTQAKAKTWQCSYCSKTFYAKKTKDGLWSCPLSIVHEDKCSRPVKPVVKEEEAEGRNKAAVQYFHELGKYPGLLEYIEILGCTDELRADQLQRAVRKKFNVCDE